MTTERQAAVAGWTLAVFGPIAVAALLVPFRDDLVGTNLALILVVVVVLAAIAGLDEAKLIEQVSFFNSKRSRLGVLAIALDHQTHHRGQTTIYLRLKGVTQPPEP
jgi:hypothetical protein